MVWSKPYDIVGVMLNWVTAFLNMWSQRVIVNGIASREEAVLSRVTQGSVLGPPLFVVYINDLADKLVCPCLMFSNDTQAFMEITEVTHMNILQDDLHQLQEWSQIWLLQFHHGKHVVIYGGIWWNIIQAYLYELLTNTHFKNESMTILFFGICYTELVMDSI